MGREKSEKRRDGWGKKGEKIGRGKR